jgi:AcrR family transcriptional regulator
MASQAKASRARQGPRVNAANTLRREARRLQFLEAAIEVIRTEGPATSMDQVAARIGITKPVVYRYFGDRNGMYRAVAERYCGELRNKFRAAMSTTNDLRSVVVVAVGAYLELAEREPQIHRFLIQPLQGRGSERSAATPFTQHVAAEIVDALRLRLEAAALDPEVAEPWGHALVGMVQAAAVWWAADHHAMPRTRLVEQLVTLVWVGLASATDAIALRELTPVEAPAIEPAQPRARRA